MKKYDWSKIEDAIIEQMFREMSHSDMMTIVRDYLQDHVNHYNDFELLDEARIFGIDVSEFEVKEVDNG